MPVISQSLTDALKQILQTFQLPFLFPATVIVLVTALLYPGQIKLDDINHLVVIGTVIVVLSYSLYASNIPFIRLLEGYVFRHSGLLRLIGKLEERRYRQLVKQINECENVLAQVSLLEDDYLLVYDSLPEELKQKLRNISEKWASKKGSLLEQKQLRFPTSSDTLLPTALGNTIAAFEDYPWSRYQMDAVHLWPRLLPILQEKKFMPFVLNEKAILDFLINSGFAAIVISFELFFVGLQKDNWSYVAFSALFLAFAYLLYHFAVVAAKHWGGMVRVAFDLYRDDLRRALYLPELPDESLDKERELWNTVSRFIVYGDDSEFKGFIYPKSQNKKNMEAKQL